MLPNSKIPSELRHSFSVPLVNGFLAQLFYYANCKYKLHHSIVLFDQAADWRFA
jgi:hypothetical protein